MKFSFQQMPYLLKHKILQFVFKCSFFSPYMFRSPWTIFRGTHQNLAKVAKITVS
jgi:hypothetical protein